ncbi:ribosome maturation factor RimP [Ectothiorhodospira lacustris]|uniref:ribosome maturation factor RimP n=1 Tax=Ectothiorhodospira lacustris TaxID=2899127 RepID=UPI001EE855D1|nr:ribosome maturation factor RimP [Ectothiorhodospira lacustris]MCG5500038.1 ribosome maturation factor RimP [Ectothiorhodospira lacustris]MCG5508647.1 ribosome maturation factor RimP [Ectothiorhodospira lacustris]MCG5520438.1 ribosome maturation factor RimP [Ectothiorhodospira lacustris]
MELKELITPVIAGLGFELWGLEYRVQRNSALLRIFIDGPNGINLDDCAAVSDQVSGVLDVEDPIPVPYRLEVSSPGMDRPLFTPDQFRRYQGEDIRVRLNWPVEGQRNYRGRIAGVEETAVILAVEENSVRLPLEAISRARLVPKF